MMLRITKTSKSPKSTKAASASLITCTSKSNQRLGKACPRLCEQSIRELLPLPIKEVRARLNITPAARYKQAHGIWRGMGIDPYDLLGKNAAKLAA